MSISLESVPSALEAPKKASRSRIRQEMIRAEFGRRTLLKGIAVAGMSIGLSSLDLLPGGPAAAARPATWWSCNGYNASNRLWTICNPCARGRPKRRKHYCNKHGFHRRNKELYGYGYVMRKYRRRHRSCDGKNTWRWRIRNDFPEPNPRNRKCSDGKYRQYKLVDGKWKYQRTRVTVCMKYVKRNVREKAAPTSNYTWSCGEPWLHY